VWVKLSSLLTTMGSLLAVSLSGHAASVTDVNIFNTGTSSATVSTSTPYSTASFPLSGVDDLSGTNNENQFFFEDGGPENILTLSNFSDPTGINTIRIYDAQEYELGRVATSVTIYTSTINQTSITPGDFTLLGTYDLPIGTNGFYVTGEDSAGANSYYSMYDDVTGLNIAPGTESILFDFGHAGNIGVGVTEIQGFEVPEPSTYALMFGAVAMLALAIRRKLAVVG
jgi:hypothetical protein